MKDETLYKKHMKALNDASFFHVTDQVKNDMLNSMSALSSDDDQSIYIKGVMNAGIGNIKLIFKNQTGMTEAELHEALAMEILQESLHTSSDDKALMDYKGMKIYSDFKDFYNDSKAGKTANHFFSSDLKRYRAAQRLDPLVEGANVSEINKVLKVMQGTWNAAESGIRVVDNGEDFIQFACTFFMLREMSYAKIHGLKGITPKNSALYDGLKRAENRLRGQGLITFADECLADKAFGKISSTFVQTLNGGVDQFFKSKLKTFSASTYLMTAEAIYKGATAMISAPSIESYQKTWMMTDNALTMANQVDAMRIYLAHGKKVDRKKYMLALKLYLTTLTVWEDYVAKLADDFKDIPNAGTYYHQMMKRNKSYLTMKNYLNVCKYHVKN